MLIWLCDWNPEKTALARRILVLDNIDPVDPRLQRFAANLFQKITLSSGIQTLIPMRPYTQATTKSVSGADWHTTEEHCSPDLIQVIDSRLDLLIANGKKDAREIIKKVKRALNRDAKHLKEIVSDTSGLDIRIGLLNFSNFVERLLAAKGADLEFDLDQSEVCRLFFLGDRNRFNYYCVENLFYYSADEDQVLTMAKIYILDFLLRYSNGSTDLKAASNYASLCGFEQREFFHSMENLLSRSRALVWSPDGFEMENLANNSTLRATPLAFTYYYRLFGEYYYTEVCMMDRRFENARPSEVAAFESDFVVRDLQVLKNIVEAEGTGSLQLFFPSASEFVGIRHWRRFQHGAKFRLKSNYIRVIDENRDTWLGKVYGAMAKGDVGALKGAVNL